MIETSDSTAQSLIGYFLDQIRGFRAITTGKYSEQLLSLKEAHSSWISSKSLRGLGIGANFRDGKETDQVVIKLYVDTLPVSATKDFPRFIDFPKYGQIETKIEQTLMPSSQHFNFFSRPLRPGLSLSHTAAERGTACAKVTRTIGKRKGQDFILSCQHVLFPGTPRRLSTLAIVQPSHEKYRDTQSSHVIAQQYLHANLDWSGLNQVDAALGRLNTAPKARMNNRPVGSNFSFNDIETNVRLHDEVAFYGARSGRRIGKIIDLFNSDTIRYTSLGRNRDVQFHNIIKCDYPNLRGDSGGPVVLLRNKKLVGMHFAGSGQTAYVCKIDKVFQALNVKLKS